MRAMSLDASGKAEEDNELSNIKLRLEFTNNLVANLSKQLDELNERVNVFFDYYNYFWVHIFSKTKMCNLCIFIRIIKLNLIFGI